MQISIRLSTLTLLIGFNILMYIIPLLLAFILVSDAQAGYGLMLQLFGGFSVPLAVEYGQWWRALTANFLHSANPLHLLANMYVLYQIGAIVWEYFGGKWLLIFYIVTGVAAMIISVPFLGLAGAVGASGAVFGLVGVLIGASVRRNVYGVDLPFGINDVLPLFLFAVLINFVPGVVVGNAAHVGGLVVGIGLGYVIPHKLTVQGRKHWDQVEQYAYYLCILALIVSYAFVVWNIISAIRG